MSIFSTMIATATAVATFLLLLTLTSANRPNRHFNKIYAFGASYVDTGNTNATTAPSIFRYASNLPYGRTFFHRPTNRYSDGRLVIDFVAESLSLPYLPPYLNPEADTCSGINYAVAGSTAIEHEFFVENNLPLAITPQSLQTQLSWFNKTLEGLNCKSAISTSRECRAVFRDSLVWLGQMGSNDYTYTLRSNVSAETIQRLANDRVTRFLEAVLNKGAKYIVVEGLPASGCLAISLFLSPASDRDDLGCAASVNNQRFIHNTILQANIQNLRRRYPKAVIVYVDYWNAYSSIIMNGPRLGFQELYKVCCGAGGGLYNFNLAAICGSQSASSCQDPSQYVNWDGLHLTEAMHKVLSDMFLEGPFTYPPLKYLLSRKNDSN
ncbi:putative sinapine esterase [Helianthus annuus]|uniref:Putative SGNH hydrolase-type esterase domain-containing protein n=1 Tax=Helianthus annuus TaxID=4232 RepID=A0A251URY2_HELAN|nr:GDSL esterase/lipase At3g48460 [Helianthus annuus]KAF5807035.1 putative sinapine esterase [Helianthus annuus]KAJ0585567.1 putative sinapine esterase [Helianthus annuus]KAJ0920143.1 putative sinapine esterase [Helianthus annuus]